MNTNTPDYESFAKKAAGNHLRFESFHWSDEPQEGSENWTIVYTHNRDSGLLEQSNAACIAKKLQKYIKNGTDVFSEHHSHWACGWVEGYAIRVYTAEGTITEAFKAWCDLQDAIAYYPVLDEEDYSRREYEATVENICNVGEDYVSDNAPEDWANQVWSWFWENKQSAVEDNDDQGGYPTPSEIEEALEAIGFLKIDEEEE